MAMRSWIRQLFAPRTPRTVRKAPARSRLDLERLEQRLAPAVTPQMLQGGILDIGFSAANDTVTVSVVGPNIDVFDGTTHTDFAATSVSAINAHGNSSPNQAVTFSSAVTLPGALTVTGLTNATVNGTYQVQSASLTDSGTIDIATGATLSAAGDITLTAQDAETGLTATSSTQVIVSGATLAGNNVSLSATSTLAPTTTGFLLAQINAQSSALVLIDGSSHITAVGNVTIAAVSTVNSSAVVKAGAADNTNLPVDAAAANSTLASSAIAHVSGTTAVSAGGTFSLSATNNSTVTTTADGTAGGSSAGGASVANAAITDTTKAFLDGSATIVKASGVNVSATETDTDTTTAKSTAKGAAQNSPGTQQLLAANHAQTSEGAIGLAAAVAVTNLTRDTQAYIASAGSVTSGGPLGVTASSSSNDTTDADSSSTVSALDGGVGVAVAINRAAQADNTAYIGGTGGVATKGVAVQALMPTPSTFGATATSGAGSENVGVAGAFALNDVPSHTSTAVIQSGANVDAGGGDVTLAAVNSTINSAAARPDAKGTSSAGVGASVALNLPKNNTADAEVQDNAGLANAGKLTIGANSTQTATADVEGGADGGVALLPAVAVIVSADATTARLGTGTAPLGTAGDVNITATHTGSAASRAKGTAAGDKAAVGAAAAVNQATDNTTATVARALNSGGAVTVTAQSSQGAEATAQAGAHAPKSAPFTANGVADSLLAAAGSGATVPIFKANGDTVGVAAALGLNLASSSARATVGSSLTAAGALTVGASDGATVTAAGDGSAVRPDVGVDPNKAGVGVGLAVNVASASGQADIALGVTVQAHGLSLTADNGAGGANTFTAASTSGGGGSSVGVAGSFAFNDIGTNASTAVIDGGASVDAGGGDVLISATNASTSTATADANDPAKGGALGVGASVALNVLPTNTADAEALDSAGLVHAGNVTVSATGTHTVTTSAVNGAAGSKLGLAAGIAVALISNDTTARLGTSASPLSATGAVTVSAAHSSTTTTTADGDTRGAKVGIGASVGVAVVNDNATAAADRSISAGGAVTVATTTTTSSDIDAKAGANGAPENPVAGTNADAQAAGAANDASNSAGVASPTLVSLETTLVNVSDEVMDKGGLGIGTLGVAAAVGVNAPTSDASASIGGGVTVTAGGAVTVSSTDQSSARAQATGKSLINNNSIGAAVGVNAATVDNEASIGPSAKVSGSSITVQATLPSGSDYDFRTRALAASGGKDVGAAGSVGVNVLNITSQASVGAGSTLTATTGSIAVTARDDTRLQNVAGGAALSLGNVGVGVSAAVNVITNSTKAFLGADTRADAPGAITVEADASFAPVTGDLPTDPLNLAAAGALSKGVSVAGSAAVNVLSDTTLAYIRPGARINTVTSGGSGQNVSVSATDDTTIRDKAGGFAAGLSNLAFGLGLDVNIITQKDTEAYIGSSAADPSNVRAGGNISVQANTKEDISSLAAQVGASQSLGLAGAVVVNVLGSNQPLDTQAYVGDSATVSAQGSISLSALDDRPLTLTAGAAGIGISTGGIGTSNATLVANDATLAFVGRNAHIAALGKNSVAPVSVLTGRNGTPVSASMHGLSLTAVSSLNLLSVAAGAAGAGNVGVAGSATVTVLTDKTLAYVDQSTTINGNNAGAGTAQDVNLLASDNTTIKDAAGSVAVGIGAGGVGAGADVEVLSKDTEAYLAPSVTARATEHVLVSAVSHEDLLSIAGSAGVSPGGNVAIAGATSVATATLTTKAYVGANATVGAGGNVVLGANDDSNVNVVDGTLAANGNVGTSIAGSVAIPIISKTTQAYIGAGATVDALGTMGPSTVRTGTFTASFVTPNSGDPVAPPREHNSDATGDIFTKLRVVTPDTTNVQGVAVSATATDQVRTVAASLGVAPLGVGVSVVGSVYLPTTTTTAYIGQGAKVNTGAAAGGTPAAAQSVLVGAGSDYYHLGVSGSGAAGLAAANPGWDVLVSTNVTKAYVDQFAQVNAQRDVKVQASQGGSLVSFVAGLGVGAAAVTGSATVVTIHDTTDAFIGAGAQVNAGGNVLVKAKDDTGSSMLVGAAALGIGSVGAGGALGLNLITKDTEAFLDAGAVVNAKGKNSTAMPVFDGNVDATNGITSNKTINGLAVQADSGTGVFSIGVAGAGGFFGGLAGAVTVSIIQADSKAFIGSGARVNQGVTGADPTQSVDVGAGNDASIRGIDGAVGASLGGSIAGGVDVGLIRNNTAAYIDTGAHVSANRDVDILALSRKTGDSLAVSAAAGAVGIAGAVAVYALDGNLDTAGSTDAAKSLKSNSGNGATTGGYADQDASAQAITSQLGGYQGQDDSSTQVMNAVRNAGTTVQQTTPKNATSSALGASVTPEGTSASVRSSAMVSAGRNVQVSANDLVELNLVAGSGALGAVGVGGSVVVAHIASDTNAYLDSGATVAAGGNVLVLAGFRETGSNPSVGLTGEAYAGSGGLVGLGAQVVEINDDSQQNAYLNNGAIVTKANLVDVGAGDVAQFNADAFGVEAGALAAGAAIAQVNANGQTEAYTGSGVQIGEQQGQSVQSLTIQAHNLTLMKARARAVAAGIGASTGNQADAVFSPTIRAALGPNSRVLVAQSILIDAESSPGASADVEGVQVGGVAVGVSLTNAAIVPTVDASIDSGAQVTATNGSVTVQANQVSLGGAQSTGSSSGIAAGTGEGANINAVASAFVDSHIGTNATVNAAGTVLVTASGDNEATASVSTLSVGILLNVAAIFATATAGGSDGAHVDAGAVVGTPQKPAGSLDVEAAGTHDSTATVDLSGGGAFSGTGGNATAYNNPTVFAYLDSGSSVDVNGNVTVKSTYSPQAHAKMTGASGGIIDVSQSRANVYVTPTIQTAINSATVTAGGNITVQSLQDAPPSSAARNNDPNHTLDVSAVAASSGGGVVSVIGAEANVHELPTTSASAGAEAHLAARGDVTITSTSYANTTAIATNRSYDLGGLGNGYATVYVTNATSAAVGDGAVITTPGNFVLQANSPNTIDAHSDAYHAAAIPLVRAYTFVLVSPETQVSVGQGAQVTAGGQLGIAAISRTGAISPITSLPPWGADLQQTSPDFPVTARAESSDSLGQYVESNAWLFIGRNPSPNGTPGAGDNDQTEMFFPIGWAGDDTNHQITQDSGPAMTEATIGTGAALTGGRDTGVTAVSDYDLGCDSQSWGGTSVGASGFSTALTDVCDTAHVAIDRGAKITGSHSVDIEARHDNTSVVDSAQTRVRAAGRAGSATYTFILGPNNQYNPGDTKPGFSEVDAAPTATIYTPNLTVKALATFKHVWKYQDTSGATNDNDRWPAEPEVCATRLIRWNADVVSGAAAAPSRLIVNADGTVDPSSTIKPTITPTQIIVPNIGGGGGGAGSITFVANQVVLPQKTGYRQSYYKKFGVDTTSDGSGDGYITSTAGPDYHSSNDLPTFFAGTTAGPIQIINYSTKNLVINNIDVLNRGATSDHVDINVLADGLWPLDLFSVFTPFHFKVGPTFAAPTLVDIENRSTTGSPNITLRGLINNPIGTTEVLNARGSVLSAGPQAVVRTNVLDVEAASGQIGSGANALSAQLVQSEDVNKVARPIQATVLAGGSAYLNLKGLLRDPDVNLSQTPFTVPLQSLRAGGDLVATLQEGERDTAPVTGNGGITVYEDYFGLTTHVFSFFRPDQGPGGAPDPGLFEGGATPIDSTYDFVDATAGHNISLQGQPVTKTIHIQANTDINPNGPGTGHIDASTNGNITITETAGAMRVGTVQSTKGNVTLTVPALPAPGQDLIVLPGGQVSAAGTVEMDAGGNVEVPASSQLHAGSSVTIVGHSANTALAGVTIDVLGKITAASAVVKAGGHDDVVNLARGQDTTPTTVMAFLQNDTVNLRNNGGSMLINSLNGPTTINVGSLARLHTFIGAATFSASQRTITRGAGSFLADGFVAGQQVSVSGTQNNNGTYQIASVSDTTLTLTPAAQLTDETAAGTKITNLHGNLNGIVGPVFINGSGTDTLNVDDTGATTNSAPVFTGPATFDATARTITRTSGSFLADGFTAGQQVLVSGTQSNNGSLTILSVSATVLTVASSPDLANETADSARITAVTGTLSTAPLAGPTGTVTATRLTGLGLGHSITYLGGVSNLNVYLGTGSDAFAVTGVNPVTKTVVDGGLGTVPNTVGVAFAQDFQGDLSLVNFQNATVQVARDFTGTLTARMPGDVQLVHVGRTLTADGVFHATGTVNKLLVGKDLDGKALVDTDLDLMIVGAPVNNEPAPGNVTGLVQVGHDFDLGYVYGSVSGLITVGNDLTSLLKVFGDTSGTVQVTRDVGELGILGSLSGQFDAGRNVTILEVGKAITDTGAVHIGGDLFSLHSGTDFTDPHQGLFGQVVVGGSLNQARVDGTMTGTLAVQGDIGAEVVGGDGSLTRDGWVIVSGPFGGQIVAMGNVYGDLWFKQDFTGRVAVHGQAAPQSGILGNVEIDGTIGPAGAIVSGGLLGDAAAGTALSTGVVSGILAAEGDISFGNMGDTSGAHILDDASGVNAAAIDAIFTDQGNLLVIDTTPQGLHNLALILTDLAALHVGPDGNLTGPTP
jgi:hypothetical protein